MNRPQSLSSKWSIAAAALGLIALAAVMFGPLSGQDARILITKQIDESRLVTLRGNTRPEARMPQDDRGRVDDSFPMPDLMLQLKRSPELEQEFAQFTESLTDKNSPNFRHWMLAAEQGEKYGVAQQDIDTISKWLESHGFTIDGVQPNKMSIDFSGTAGQVREAFHTEIHNLEVRGERHFANMSDPQIPGALAPAVVGVVAMHDFKPHPNLVPRVTNGALYTGSSNYPLVATDFQTIYNLIPLYKRGINGAGQTITLVESSAIKTSADITTYRNTFLSGWSGTVTASNPSGSSSCTNGTNSADGESNLDAEMASAIAPNATIVVATCTQGTLNAVQNLVNSASPPAIISMSYGECEIVSTAATNLSYKTAFQTGATAGVSIFVSTGDVGGTQCSNGFTAGKYEGLSGIGVTGWGETIYNVAVGGTDFEDLYNTKEPIVSGGSTTPQTTYWGSNTSNYGSAKSYIPEIPWNDSCGSWLIMNYQVALGNGAWTTTYGSSGFCNSTTATTNNAYLTTSAAAGGPSGCATGGGGVDQTSYDQVDGTCAGYTPKPSWQSGVSGNPADGVRDIPDVSMFASNGVWGHYAVVCYTDTTNGGTACTAGNPGAWSGFGGTSVATPIMASIQALVNEKWGLIKVGNPNPTYYSIANAQFTSAEASDCYSSNLPGRRGLGSACAFNDITQGDNAVDCTYNGTFQNGCYLPSGTYGSLSTQPPVLSITAPGSGYSSAPTCAIGGVSAYTTPYLSPTGGTIFSGGTAATCTAVYGQYGTLTASSLPTGSTCGTVTVGATTYTCKDYAATLSANQFWGCESGNGCTSSAYYYYNAGDLLAVINANPQQCVITGCVPSGQTANSSVVASIISTTGSASTSPTITLGAKTNGGTFTLSTTGSSGFTAATTTTTGVAYVTVSGTGGYAPGQPVTCTLTGSHTTAATCLASQVASVPAPGYAPAFFATPGWDFATGLGSVNAYNLAMNTKW
jgi:subtilase family serine protease